MSNNGFSACTQRCMSLSAVCWYSMDSTKPFCAVVTTSTKLLSDFNCTLCGIVVMQGARIVCAFSTGTVRPDRIVPNTMSSALSLSAKTTPNKAWTRDAGVPFSDAAKVSIFDNGVASFLLIDADESAADLLENKDDL